MEEEGAEEAVEEARDSGALEKKNTRQRKPMEKLTVYRRIDLK